MAIGRETFPRRLAVEPRLAATHYANAQPRRMAVADFTVDSVQARKRRLAENASAKRTSGMAAIQQMRKPTGANTGNFSTNHGNYWPNFDEPTGWCGNAV